MPVRCHVSDDLDAELNYLYPANPPEQREHNLDEDHWDCECDVRYIHPKGMKWCPFCRTRQQDQPDSRLFEVAEFQEKGDTSIDLVLPGTDVLPDWMLTEIYEQGVKESKEEAA